MRSLFIQQLVLSILFAFFLSSCGDEEIGNQLETNRVEDKAEYELHISSTSGVFKTLIGENLEGARWKPDMGFVWLSTDLNNEPLGTLTLSIVRDPDKVDGYANVIGAVLSTTDVRVGTGGEINGKLYQQLGGLDEDNFIKIKEIGANYIFVEEFNILMVEVSDEAEVIGLSGWFIAKDE